MPIFTAGIAAGATAFFVGSPLDGRMTIGTTRIAVLDSGGVPAPGTIDAEPSIYE